jgi:hypothetical protein
MPQPLLHAMWHACSSAAPPAASPATVRFVYCYIVGRDEHESGCWSIDFVKVCSAVLELELPSLAPAQPTASCRLNRR